MAEMGADHFQLLTHWHLDAPRGRVWAVLRRPERWPRWWRYVASVQERAPGDSAGIGARHGVHWTSKLPYSLTLETEVVELQTPTRIRVRAHGDLEGEGLWELRDEGAGTAVDYTWRVTLDKPWMRRLAPLMRPVFEWNHHAVMAAGEQGLAAYLARGDDAAS